MKINSIFLKKVTQFLSLVFFATGFVANGQAVLKGVVKDAESGQMLAGASVFWQNTNVGQKTDSEGKFALKPIAGDNLLVISYVGFETKTISKNLFNTNSETEIVLSKTIYQADEVIVNANRANDNSGMAFTNIGKDELLKSNAGQDMPNLLNFTPSMVTTSDAGAGIGYTGMRIRGTDATRINVMVNGIPINDSESQGVYWVNMPDLASSVSSVQIQRGVGTSANGTGAFGASINIQSNEFNKKSYAEINSSVGSFNSFKNTIKLGSGLVGGKFTFDGRLSRITSDGFVDRGFSKLNSYYLSGAYYGKKSFVRLVHFAGNEKTYQSWNGIAEDKIINDRKFNAFTYPNQTDNYGQNHYQLLSTHSLSNNWSANINLHYTKGKGYYEEFKEADKLASYGLPNIVKGIENIEETDIIRQKWLDNDFFGTTFSLDYLSYKNLSASIGGGVNKYIGDHFGEVISAVGANVPTNYRWYESQSIKADANIYGKLNLQITSKVNVFTDLQLRQVGLKMKGTASKQQAIDQEHNYSFFNPKVGFTAQFNEQILAYTSFSVGQKEPNRTDFIDSKNIIAPKSEKLNDLELGIKLNTAKTALSINGYLMNYKDQLVLTGAINDVGESIRTNIPKSRRVGVELDAAWLLTKKISWKANATFSKNTVRNLEELIPDYEGNYLKNKFSETDIAFSPNVIVGSQFILKPTKLLEMALLTKYVGKQFLDNTSNEARKLNSYFTNDLRVLYTLKTKRLPELNIGLYANNMFSEEYESNGYTFSYLYDKQVYTENYYYPQAGRNFMVSLNIKFQ